MRLTELHPLPTPLARAHAWTRSQASLARFTMANRLLLAMAFFPTGLVKATGQRFTTMPLDNPVGFFFEAMYQTGPYWNFIGAVQVLAAVLLLIPATAAWGAVLFLPVGVSVFLITWGIGFSGTVWVTLGMLLSVLYLICWDGDRVWAAGAALLGRGTSPDVLAGMHRVEAAGWGVGGACGLALFLVTRSFLPNSWIRWLLVGSALAVALVVLGWGLGARRRKPRVV